jgi:hypothetical protein
VALPPPVQATRVPHGLDRVPAAPDPRSLKSGRAHVYALAFALGAIAVALLAALGAA